MKLNKKIILIIFIVINIIILSSCNLLSDNIENMIMPPSYEGDVNNVLNTIKKSVDKDITLKYPKMGEYKTPITLVNIDDEDGVEAVAFYSIPSTNNEAYTLRIGIVDFINGKWELAYNLGVEAKGVEKLDVIYTENKIYIAVGLQVVGANSKEVRFYEYQNNKLEKKAVFYCNEYYILDIDMDNSKELVTLSTRNIDEEKRFNTAMCIKISDNGFRHGNVINMDNRVKEYIGVSRGILYVGKPALFIDGVRDDGKISTQIITFGTHNIENPLFNLEDKYNLTDKTVRNNKVVCSDIDNDGVLEIPIQEPFYGYEHIDDHNKLYITTWKYYNLGKVKDKYITYSDFSLNFYFILPEKFLGEVSMFKNVSQNLITFSAKTSTNTNRNEELFSIQVVKRSDFEANEVDRRFRVLEKRGHLVYMYHIYEENSDLALTSQDIFERFKIFPNNN